MAFNDWQLPFVRRVVSEYLSTPASCGVVVRRRRFQRPVMQEEYVFTFENMTLTDLSTWISILDGLKGGASQITLSLPDVGSVSIMLSGDGYTYTVGAGEYRSIQFSAIAEVRIS